jgi:1-deoxy-D-xylulose-5-phosphate synthase
VLLHVVTEKGHGFQPAAEDPAYFHTPPVFVEADGKAIPKPAASSRSYTHTMRDAIVRQMRDNPRVVVMTAAMCQGNMLEPVRDEFPDRFFDTGICESHTVAFAAGMAKAGMRPIVDIYSTFLQRAYDQVFQEVSLQRLPVVFTMDRAGLTGPDGPTHHGVFDIVYMRAFPHLVVMVPGDAHDVDKMLEFALQQDAPCAIRYPKASAHRVQREVAELQLGRAEILRWGADGVILCCGALLHDCVQAANTLRQQGLNIGVVNARFAKPLDQEVVARAVRECGFVITVEEGTLIGGFGSAVLETAADLGLDTSRIRRLGIPDTYIEHGERAELLADLQLDAPGIAQACRNMALRVDSLQLTPHAHLPPPPGNCTP